VNSSCAQINLASNSMAERKQIGNVGAARHLFVFLSKCSHNYSEGGVQQLHTTVYSKGGPTTSYNCIQQGGPNNFIQLYTARGSPTTSYNCIQQGGPNNFIQLYTARGARGEAHPPFGRVGCPPLGEEKLQLLPRLPTAHIALMCHTPHTLCAKRMPTWHNRVCDWIR
jgi:hypothetical protein